MALQIHNTMTGQKQPFEPISPGRVRMYVCGPTVYDMSHIGHARAYVSFDVVARYLRRSHQVTYVRNYTDVDDKIIKRAGELGEKPQVLSERFIGEFKADMAALGVGPADVEPKVTDHIREIIALIGDLEERGYAYAASGDVYYAIEKFPGYGRLSHRTLDDMEAGARVEPSERKRNPLDFALWKAAKPGEPAWESPWGKGRPGWHIECSAMSSKYLGETFDIHGGGKDLVFPHHENEIAQSEGAHGKPFARVWMHNGFVNIDNEKMSKSLGNFFTIREVLGSFDSQSLRYFLLTTHYRSPISFSDAALREAEARVRYVYQTLGRLRAVLRAPPAPALTVEPPAIDGELRGEIIARFVAAMDDDFNTAKALGDLSDVFKSVNDKLSSATMRAADLCMLRAVDEALREVSGVLGVFDLEPESVLARMEKRRKAERRIDSAEVERLIAERAAARRAKDFARADSIRQQLAQMGVSIKDSPGGTTWETN